MKRLILLLAASLILASPAFAWKEKVYRIEWTEWGLKDGMKTEQIAKQLDKKGVKYHPFEVSHANSYFPSDMFQIDSVQRWGITWDKVRIEAQNALGCVPISKRIPIEKSRWMCFPYCDAFLKKQMAFKWMRLT